MPAIPYPALVPVAGGAVVAEGTATRRVGRDEARRIFRSGDVLLAHAVFVSGRLRSPPQRAVFDVLELFAFVRPAHPFIPSPLGLAR
jgi:ATP-dependent DNA helicase DinG